MQENKTHILCTRPLNEMILMKAVSKNIYIDTIPFIETQALNDEVTVQYIQVLSRQNITAVFTSMNAVEAVKQHITEAVNWKIFCLGGITRELVHQHFGKAAIAGTAKNATDLAKKIIADSGIQETVFFCGDQHLDFLPKTLKENDVLVSEFIVYKTILVPQVIEKDYDGIVFFSPSAAHSFFSINTIRHEAVLFAIGSTTAAAIQTYCTNKIITSQWPDKEQMIDKVIGYFNTINADPGN